jgi:hypothetical protein
MVNEQHKKMFIAKHLRHQLKAAAPVKPIENGFYRSKDGIRGGETLFEVLMQILPENTVLVREHGMLKLYQAAYVEQCKYIGPELYNWVNALHFKVADLPISGYARVRNKNDGPWQEVILAEIVIGGSSNDGIYRDSEGNRWINCEIRSEWQ